MVGASLRGRNKGAKRRDRGIWPPFMSRFQSKEGDKYADTPARPRSCLAVHCISSSNGHRYARVRRCMNSVSISRRFAEEMPRRAWWTVLATRPRLPMLRGALLPGSPSFSLAASCLPFFVPAPACDAQDHGLR